MAEKDRDHFWSSLTFKLALNTASHPFEYAKVLIQIGHEPIAPFPTRTILRRPALGLPNVIEYVKYIKTIDGFRGCYRGLGSRLLANSVNLIASSTVSDATSRFSYKFISCLPEDEFSQTDKWLSLWRDALVEISGKTAGIVASHPFQVITIRIMAQFVGGESHYNGIFASIAEIYNTDGILGFFSGLIPRLLGEIFCTTLIHACVFFVKNMIKDEEVIKFSNFPILLVGSTLSYPFHVVSTCMAVNNCGLVAGNPPQMPVYKSWIECWRHLSRTDQLKRGSAMFFRYYSGPHVYSTGYHNLLIKRD